ncbi:MAG TPA: ATP-binding protein [Gemmatimonadaceae bacterium]|nr:ATP-binding protein [Gemmatimonadaceae bacterium]
MNRIRIAVAPSSAVTPTRLLAALTVVWIVLLPPRGHAATVIVDALLAIQFAGVAWLYGLSAIGARGTRRALFAGLACGCAFAVVARTIATVNAATLQQGPSLAEAYAGIALHVSILAGFATALGRYRHRNWMRFEAMVDALLLIVAAAIVLVQLDGSSSVALSRNPSLRALALISNTLAAANVILVALLLAWRGEVLGERLATALSLGVLAMGVSSFLYVKPVLLGGEDAPRVVLLVWSVGVWCFIHGIRERKVAALTEESVESPTYASDAARVRTFSIVIAIVIAIGSATGLALSGERSESLGLALLLFGLLLALRAGYALWGQQRTTSVLEHAALAEREQSALLERHVAARTAELAEAHRVMQRMWTLGQQIALELTPERVLRRFIEAAMDVLRVEGGAVGLLDGDRVQIAITAGLGESLEGRSFAVSESAMGRVARAATAWWTADADASPEPTEDIPLGEGARSAVVIPLQRRGQCVGAVTLLSRFQRDYSDIDVAHVEAMADLLSVALANADLLETLRKAEWRFRTLFRAAPDAVLTVFESGRIREANDAVHDIFGVHPVQMVGRTLDEFVVPEDVGRLRQELAHVLNGAPSRLEIRARHGMGEKASVRIVQLAARLLPEADPPQVLFLGRDMTSEREMRARLAETERLAAVGELVAGVAHEVNNPLCTISAFAQLLQRDDDLRAEQRESVDVICSETQRASQVLRDLLTFARRSEGENATIQINDLIERTMRLRLYEMDSLGIATEYDLASDLPLTRGDPRQSQQVLLNLVMNAIQAMEPMGGGTLRLRSCAEGESVVLEVSDTGPGIPEPARAHVFEPFYTTKPTGTGLGLSVSYGIVASHGGKISIVGTGESGTTFRITLPALYGADDSESDSIDRISSDSPLSGMHLLFVDDELALHSAVRSYARARGFTVVTAADGAAALAAARREHFDAVACDLRMGGLDGPALFEILRREHPELAARTLFITGDLMSASSRGFLESAGQPVLEKPFDLERLESSMAALLDDQGELAAS